jgi:hypothetical protein
MSVMIICPHMLSHDQSQHLCNLCHFIHILISEYNDAYHSHHCHSIYEIPSDLYPFTFLIVLSSLTFLTLLPRPSFNMEPSLLAQSRAHITPCIPIGQLAMPDDYVQLMYIGTCQSIGDIRVYPPSS